MYYECVTVLNCQKDDMGMTKKGETVVISECVKKTNVGISARPI